MAKRNYAPIEPGPGISSGGGLQEYQGPWADAGKPRGRKRGGPTVSETSDIVPTLATAGTADLPIALQHEGEGATELGP
jgi:hypothetical protein